MSEITKEILKDFGAHLKKLRERKGLTLLDLEVRSGINNGDISRIEGGKINLAFTTLAKLAKGLDVSMSELVKF
ncbi:helix-turn-helix domain-containing protein [Chitinophaga vietnamensis]|uniref:helix-turn-helix domain-containing protein n=1 Tax=Chitinophaga vietnamensis TaxID=2593957 RepID=UPI001177EBEB|nr:helix-turn-helix transcriptional regulator [Chitinophaga vietnamensis]